jgi:hypothetical protein
LRQYSKKRTRKKVAKTPPGEQLTAIREASLRMPLSVPHTRDFWATLKAASTTVKRMATSSSLRKNYFVLAATEKIAVSEILDTPATNSKGYFLYKDYRWFRMALNRLAFMKDIQGNQLWKICKFQLGDLYKVAPQALENFHEVLGELQNEFPAVSEEEFERECKRIGEEFQEELVKHRGQHKKPTYAEREVPHRKIGEFLRNYWYEQALNNPTSSSAGQLSQMVGHVVFNTVFNMCRRVAFELSQRNAQHQKGSCRVKRISVRSARTFWLPPDDAERHETPNSVHHQKLHAYDKDKPELNYDSPSGVLVQIKLLYCLQRTIEPVRNGRKRPLFFSAQVREVEAHEEEAYHCEATFEGWLHGGPEGTLQWRVIEFLDLNKTNQ